MMFTVEITTAAATAGWAVHRRVLDTVPGSILIEDVEQPVLMVPVDATDPMTAARFVDGVCKLVGLSIVSGTIYETPAADFDAPEDGEAAPESEVVSTVRVWMDRTPDITESRPEGDHVFA